jgi:hypothetical protein
MSWATFWATFWQTRLVTLFANNPFVTALIKQSFGNGKSAFVSKRFFSRLWRVWLVCPTIKKCRKNRGRRKKVFVLLLEKNKRPCLQFQRVISIWDRRILLQSKGNGNSAIRIAPSRPGKGSQTIDRRRLGTLFLPQKS